MPVSGPKNVTSAQLARSLQTMEKAVAKATQSDGTVDVNQLEKALEKADAGSQLGLDSIVDAFQRDYSYTTGGGCGSSVRHHSGQRDPSTLDAGEVQSVLTALLQARAKAEGFDTHKASGAAGQDGKISTDEAARAAAGLGDSLADELAGAALQGAENEAAEGTTQLAQLLSGQLERVAAAVRVGGGRDGSIEMDTLQMAFARLPEGIDGDALFESIQQAFPRARTVRVDLGCGDSRTETRYDDPTKLTAAEAEQVQDALSMGVQLLADATDSLGRLSRNKLEGIADDARATSDLAGMVMDTIVDEHLPPPPPRPSYDSGGC